MRWSFQHQDVPPSHVRYVTTASPLHRAMAFTGRTIDDVINDPIARNEVRGYFKLHKFVESRCEFLELEKQWNPLGRSG